jgi:hypothetical protein
MQGWELWLVPLVAIGIWILGTLLRGSNASNEEKEASRQMGAGGPRDRPGMGDRQRRPAQAGGDLDRFLREVQRRKQGGEARPAQAARPLPVARPVEPRRPAAPPRVEPLPRATARPAPAPPAPRRPAPRPPAPSRQPAARPRFEEPIPVVEIVEEAQAGPVWQGTAVPSAPVQVVSVATEARLTSQQAFDLGRGKGVSPALAQLAALLRTPQGLRNAMLLREILAPPLCHRQR